MGLVETLATIAILTEDDALPDTEKVQRIRAFTVHPRSKTAVGEGRFLIGLQSTRVSYNIAPSQKVFTIRFNPETQQRSLDALQWGLIPYWVKDSKIAYRTINARAETVDKAPSFRQAFIKRRCLIPADGFFNERRAVRLREPDKKPPGTEMFDRCSPLALCRRRPVAIVQAAVT